MSNEKMIFVDPQSEKRFYNIGFYSTHVTTSDCDGEGRKGNISMNYITELNDDKNL